MKLTLLEFNTKLACLSCCLSDKAITLLNKQKMGIGCADEFLWLKYYTILLEILKCYTVDDTLTVEEQDEVNLFNECTLKEKLEQIENFCGLC